MEWENSYLHISPCFFVILTIYVLNDVLTDSLALIFPFFLLMIDVLKNTDYYGGKKGTF